MLWGTVLLAGMLVVPSSECATRMDWVLEGLRDEPARLAEFVREMPKGGDLHTHLSGAVPTDDLIDLAVADDLCVDTADFTASGPDCGIGGRPASDSIDDGEFRDGIVRAWSMKGFVPAPGRSGHDHFFAAFTKFSAATDDKGKMLAIVAQDAARQHVSYLEPLVSRQGSAVKDIARRVAAITDPDERYEAVLADLSFAPMLAAAVRETEDDLARMRSLLDCETSGPAPGCDVTVRFDHQVSRATKNENVFVNLVLGFELARADPNVVGLNLVQPEDAPEALAGYSEQMRMIRSLRARYPEVKVSLHAGELNAALVPPADLTFHIREAVEVAGADRIGHGVAIAREDARDRTLATMARRGVPVEIALSSNCMILEVCTAAAHPFGLYRAHGVPLLLATDDQGVSGSDLTHEYLKAIEMFGLSYTELKELARGSLKYSFADPATRRALTEAQDEAFTAFEARYSPR